MKRIIKYIVFILLLCISVRVNATNINAHTIKETTENDSYDTIEPNTTIIGITKFTSQEVITAAKATKAGADDARLYIRKNSSDDGYVSPTIYIYYGEIGGWYALDKNNNATYIEDEQLINKLANSDIYYINNEEKIISIKLDYQVDTTRLPNGVESDGTYLYVSSSIYQFDVYDTNNKKKSYVLENLGVEESTNYIVSLNLNGGLLDYDEIEVTAGKSIGELPTPIEPDGKYFVGWYINDTKVDSTYKVTNNVTLDARYNNSVQSATYSIADGTQITGLGCGQQISSEISRCGYDTYVGATPSLVIQNVDEEFTYSTSDTTIATVSSTGIMNILEEGDFYLILTGKKSGKKFKIKFSVSSPMYSVIFYANGEEVNSEYVYEGDSIGELASGPTVDGKVFIGWYTAEEGGQLVNSSYIPTSNTNLYARYGNSIASATVKALTPHIKNTIATCQADPGCSGFGIIPPYRAYVNSIDEDIWTIEVSNVDEEYYFSSSDENIATVSSTGVITALAESEFSITVTGVESGSTKTFDFVAEKYSYEVDLMYDDDSLYDSVYVKIGEPIGNLPAPESTSLIETKEFIGWYTAEEDGQLVDSSYIPSSDMKLYAKYRYSLNIDNIVISPKPNNVTVEYDEKGVEIFKIQVFKNDILNVSVKNSNETYVFETSDISVASLSSENHNYPCLSLSDTYTQIDLLNTGTSYITISGVDTEGKIEIYVIEKTYNIKLDPNGGDLGNNVLDEFTIIDGETIGELPVPDVLPSETIFDGWYTESGTKVDSTYVPTEDMTLYARYKNTVKLANLDIDDWSMVDDLSCDESYIGSGVYRCEFGFRVGNQLTITVSNVDEEYTLSSTNENIATVTSGGVVTGVGAGECNIILRGTESGKILFIPFSIYPTHYSIKYYIGNNLYSESSVPFAESIGNYLPTLENTDGKTFEGWYTALRGGNVVNSSYVPTSNMKLYARYRYTLNSPEMELEPAEYAPRGSFEIDEEGVETFNRYVYNNKEILIVIPDQGENYTYASSNPSVASVSSNGVISTHTTGQAWISVTGTTKKGKFLIYVTNEPTN